jgi:cathepsin F
MNSKILITIVMVCLVLADKEVETFQQFSRFIKKYKKTYNSLEEFTTRFENFRKNYLRLNALTMDKGTSYSVGINKFSDLTVDEYNSNYLNLKVDTSMLRQHEKSSLSYLSSAPDSFDWRDKGAVSPVKNQGTCTSGGAFGVVGTLEGQYAIKNGTILQLSEQQIVDCNSQTYCNGGLMNDTYIYLEQAGGIESQNDYPQTELQEDCKFDIKKTVIKVNSHTIKTDMDENDLKEWLFSNGPLAIAINGTPLLDYTGGIIEDCGPLELNHAVTLIGYGNENGKDYWIAKNSWGVDWGEKGYFRMVRGKGTCGVNQFVSTADVTIK